MRKKKENEDVFGYHISNDEKPTLFLFCFMKN